MTEAVDKLSRVAVVLDFIVVEENVNEPRPLSESVERLEDHGQYGLYTVLCQLRVLYSRWTTTQHQEVSLSTERLRDDHHDDLASVIQSSLSGTTLSTVTRASHRHLRVYAILENLGYLLLYLADRFGRLHATL